MPRPGLYLGLGDAASDLDAAITGLLLKSPSPSSTDVQSFLSAYASGTERNTAAQALLGHGVSPGAVSSALSALDAAESWSPSTLLNYLSVASMALCVFHGYRRNNSIGWALAWGLAGIALPVVTPVIAVAQGFGQRKSA